MNRPGYPMHRDAAAAGRLPLLTIASPTTLTVSSFTDWFSLTSNTAELATYAGATIAPALAISTTYYLYAFRSVAGVASVETSTTAPDAAQRWKTGDRTRNYCGGFVTDGAAHISLLFGVGGTPYTPGSILFASATGGITEDNAGLFFNAANNFLGINLGATVPIAPLHVNTSGNVKGLGCSQLQEAPAPGVAPGLLQAWGTSGAATIWGAVTTYKPTVGGSPVGALTLWLKDSAGDFVAADEHFRALASGFVQSKPFTTGLGTNAIPLDVVTTQLYRNLGVCAKQSATAPGLMQENGAVGAADATCFTTYGGFIHILKRNAAGNFVGGDTWFSLDSTGHLALAFGTLTPTPTAKLHIAAGAAAASSAPIKLDAGTLLGSAEAGAIERTTDALYATLTLGGTVTRVPIASEPCVIQAKNGAYNAVILDFIKADATGGGFTVTLPTAVGQSGRKIRALKIDATANVVTLACTGGQTINGAATQPLGAQWIGMTVTSDGANWIV